MGKETTKKGKQALLQPEKKQVEAFAAAAEMPAWELAALRQATGWAPGKAVAAGEFTHAVAALRSRRQGGGKISIG